MPQADSAESEIAQDINDDDSLVVADMQDADDAEAAPSTVPKPGQGEGIPRIRTPAWSNNSGAQAAAPRLPSGAHAPWTPTAQLGKRKVYPKRMRHLLETLKGEYTEQVCSLLASMKALAL